MKKEVLTLTIIIVSLLCGCTEPPPKVVQIETIEYKKEISLQKLFEIFVKEIEIIPLENSKESMIGEYPGFEMFDNFFYIYNTSYNPKYVKKIMRFDSNGRFVNNIGLIGRGPEEFTDFRDITVDNRGVLVLSSGKDKTIYRYDHNGKFINKTALDKMPLQIFSYKEGYLLSYGFNYEKGRVVFTDSIGNSGKPLLNEKKFFISSEDNQAISSSCNDFLTFKESFSDTVYRIADFEVKPAYVFDMKEFSTSPHFFNFKEGESNITTHIMNSKISSIYYFHENQRYILSSTSFLSKENSFISCMIKDKIKNEFEWVRFNKNDATNSLLSSVIMTDNNEIYSVITPVTLLALPDSTLSLVKNREVLNNLREDDNHVILKISLK